MLPEPFTTIRLTSPWTIHLEPCVYRAASLGFVQNYDFIEKCGISYKTTPLPPIQLPTNTILKVQTISRINRYNRGIIVTVSSFRLLKKHSILINGKLVFGLFAVSGANPQNFNWEYIT